MCTCFQQISINIEDVVNLSQIVWSPYSNWSSALSSENPLTAIMKHSCDATHETMTGVRLYIVSTCMTCHMRYDIIWHRYIYIYIYVHSRYVLHICNITDMHNAYVLHICNITDMYYAYILHSDLRIVCLNIYLKRDQVVSIWICNVTFLYDYAIHVINN